MGFLEERDLHNLPRIPEYYKGKTIFITGGSGFMGKVLLEKLLYSCPDLDRVYLLMRNKKGVKSEDRLPGLYASHCFDRLRAERPGVFQSKVFVIAGDVIDVGMGLSEEDRTLLVNRVNIIFHVAASVRFDDPLPYAARMNVRGTKEVVDLAKDVRDLSALVHVSTAYCNTNHNPIGELVYPPLADWRDTLDICEVIDEHTVKSLTPKYLVKMPNTYVFTKQLAEHVVYEQKGKLPIVIIRPSIVTSSVAEPLTGWVDNFNGPTGLVVAGGIGIIRSIYADPDLIVDNIPVDFCIKGFITAAWLRGTKQMEDSDDIAVYNCSGSSVSVTLPNLQQMALKVASFVPLNNTLWTPGCSVTSSKIWHYIRVLFLHLLPAIFVDSLLRICGRKPLLVKLQRRVFIATLALRYFMTRQWTFENKNFIGLRSCIKDEDKKEFYYDLENVDKFEYIKNAAIAGRRYLLKEKDEDIPRAKKHNLRMLVLDKLVKMMFFGFFFWWFVNTKFVQNFCCTISDVDISY